MLNHDMIVWKLKTINEHHQNIIMKQIVQEIMVDGYQSIPILKKLQVRAYLLIFKIPYLLLAYTTKAACEAASTSQYQYKWARKYYRMI